MTKQEFLELPATRKGLRLLSDEFKRTNNVFFLEVSRSLKDRLNYSLPKNDFFKNILHKYISIKDLGYREELTLPF